MAKWDLEMTPEEFYAKEEDPFHIKDNPMEKLKREDLAMLVSRESIQKRHRYYKKGIDLACGEGWFTERVAPFCNELWACDISETAVGRAIEGRTENVPWCVKYFVKDIREPLDGYHFGTYDFILLSEALYYFTPKERVYVRTNIGKLLTDDGHLFVVIGQEFEPHDISKIFFNEINFDMLFKVKEGDAEYFIMKGSKKWKNSKLSETILPPNQISNRVKSS